MQRRRDEIRANSRKIKEECESILQILNRIMHKDAESVANLERLSEKQILSNKKHFLSITKYQHSVMQKVTEISLELEAFESENVTSDVNESTGSSIHSIFDSTLKIDKPEMFDKSVKSDSGLNGLILGGSPKMAETTKAENPSAINSLSLGSVEALKTSAIDSDKSVSSGPSNEIYDISGEREFLKPCANTTEDLLNLLEDVDGEKSSTSCYPDETDKEVEVEKVSLDVSSNDDSSTKNKKLKVCGKKGKSKTAKHAGKTPKHVKESKSEEKIPQSHSDKPKSVLESIRDKKPVSRKDRLLQKMPKVSMPDLSFKPSSRSVEASDSYLSCLDSGSSTSDEIMTKKKNQSIVLLENIKNENFKVAHLTLQDPPDPTLGMVCVISHMVSPAEIYINPADDNVGLLDCFTYQFAEFYENTISPYATKDDVRANVGNYCLSYVNDWSSWYRITVINWRLEDVTDPDLVTVKLVDYGHVTNVDFRNLRELLYDFCSIPMYAIKCHLAHLHPPGSKVDALLEKWPTESLQHLYDITNNEHGDCFKVTFVEKSGDSWGIELLSVHEDDDQNSVGHQLLTLGGAVEILPNPNDVFRDNFLISQLKAAQGFSGIMNMMTEDEKLEKFYDNTDDYEADNLDEALTYYKANDEERICQFARKDGTCFKGPKCKLEHGQLRKDGYTTDRQYVYTSSFNTIASPKSGDVLKLFVTSIVNVNTFYCYQVGKSSSHKDLINLMTSMNDPVTVAKYKSLRIAPASSEMVIARRLQDQWHRARVLDNYHFPDKNEVTIQVFLVDLGETIDVTMSDLRQIEPVYLNLPFQAILCRLHNVRPLNDESNNDVKLYCESNFLSERVEAKVIYSSHTYLEVLMEMKNSVDIGEKIIIDGYGLLKTNSYAPTCVENILID